MISPLNIPIDRRRSKNRKDEDRDISPGIYSKLAKTDAKKEYT